ncbi:flippase [Pedobacter sp. KACC 23697]|uniref:Flippase n=1 Tax=Pedobacter sp. KACC 23697 TaxID=3149230 RepID=A0AAU7K3A6_9SPHI
MKLPTIKGFDEEAFNKYLKNTGLLMLGRVGSLAIKMAVSIMVANYLLAFNNGILTSAIAYTYLFASIAGLGLDQFIVKELHQFPGNRDTILGTAFWLKATAGLICIPAIFLAWTIRPLADIPYHIILTLSFTGLFQSLTVIDSYFQSEVQSKYIMQVQIVGNFISALTKVMLIMFSAELIYFVYSFLFDTVLLSVGYFYVYQRKGRNIFNWNFNKELAIRLLHFSWPLIISGIMVSVYMKIDQLMLKEIMGHNGTAEAGAYATAVSLSEALNFVPVAIVTSLFPAILNARRDNPERYQKRLQNLYDLMAWLSLAFALFVTFAAPYIYKLFNPEFAFAAPALALHVWGSIFVFLGVASGQYLIAEGFSRLTFIRTGFGAAVNIVLNLILIPKMGMIGTAIATVIAYFCSTFFILLFKKTRQQGYMMLKSLFLITAFQKIFNRS